MLEVVKCDIYIHIHIHIQRERVCVCVCVRVFIHIHSFIQGRGGAGPVMMEEEDPRRVAEERDAEERGLLLVSADAPEQHQPAGESTVAAEPEQRKLGGSSCSAMETEHESSELKRNDELPENLNDKELMPSSSSSRRAALGVTQYLGFVCLGFAPAYLLPVSLFMQVPFYDGVAARLERLPAQLNIAVNLGTVPAFALAALQYCVRRTAKLGTIMATLVITEVVATAFLAFSWNSTFVIGDSDPVCWSAITAGFIGGAVGATGEIFNGAYLMNCHPRAISAFFTGSNSVVLFSAVLAAIQQPGSAQLFTPLVYFVVLAVILCSSVFVFFRGYVRMDHARHTNDPDKAGRIQMPRAEQVLQWRWVKRVIGLGATNFFLQLGCWGILASIIPYAASRVDGDCHGGGGGSVLQWVYIVSFSNLVLGSIVAGLVGGKDAALLGESSSTSGSSSNGIDKANHQGANGSTTTVTVQRIKHEKLLLGIPLAAFWVLFILIVSISIGVGTKTIFSTTAGAVVLVVAAGAARFVDGFMAVMLNRIIRARFGSHDREAAALIVGACGKIAVLIGSFVVLPLASYLDRHCH